MVRKGQVIKNKVTGEKVTFIENAADTTGKRLRFILHIEPPGFVIVNHIYTQYAL
jgi:hypothetical protein